MVVWICFRLRRCSRDFVASIPRRVASFSTWGPSLFELTRLVNVRKHGKEITVLGGSGLGWKSTRHRQKEAIDCQSGSLLLRHQSTDLALEQA